MNEKKPVSIAIIGAGIAGLAATKEFVEQGFDVTTFERYDTVGGVWSYRPDPAQRSVARDTMINSSKFSVNILINLSRANISSVIAISLCLTVVVLERYIDLTEYPIFPSHVQVKEYFESYCQQFGLLPHIKLEHDVVSATKLGAGGWRIETSSKYGKETWFFDKIILSTGRFEVPRYPPVEDLDKFEGSLIHTVVYFTFLM
jgi:dimethylaniline monooxygenase (N-oxide forming)